MNVPDCKKLNFNTLQKMKLHKISQNKTSFPVNGKYPNRTFKTILII